MKFSISNIAWDKENDEQVYAYLREHAFQGLEIAPTRLWSEPYSKIETAKVWASELQTKYGLSVSSMQSIWYGKQEKICSSEEDRKILLDYTNQAILFAETIGCKNLVFGCPKNRLVNDAKDYDIIAEFLDMVGKYAFEHHTCFSLEPNPTIYGTNFLNTTKQAVELCRRLNNQGIRINYDFGTVIENKEDIRECLDNLDLVNHVHISEPYLVKINQRKEHKELIKGLSAANYQGFVSIEMKKQDDIEDVFETIDYVGAIR